MNGFDCDLHGTVVPGTCQGECRGELCPQCCPTGYCEFCAIPASQTLHIPSATNQVINLASLGPAQGHDVDFSYTYEEWYAQPEDDDPSFLPKPDTGNVQQEQPCNLKRVVIPIRIGRYEGVDRACLVKFHVPTAFGSCAKGTGYRLKLKLQVKGGKLQYLGRSKEDAPKDGLEHDLPPNSNGWHYAQYDGGDGQVAVTLIEIAYAREDPDGAAPPLIPWNFWFFPYSKGIAPALTQLDKEGLTSGAVEWEQSYHLRFHKEEAGSWAGHCDAGAVASVIFTTPTAHGNLDESMMRFIATEWTMTYQAMKDRWRLLGDLEKFAVSEIESGLTKQGTYNKEHFELLAKKLGQQAADFHYTLEGYLAFGGEPLLTDLRRAAERKARTKETAEVWNHAIFFYAAAYVEDVLCANSASDAPQAQTARLKVLFVCNRDCERGGLAAKPDNDKGLAITDYGSRRHLVYELRFGADGSIVRDAPENHWRACTTEAGSMSDSSQEYWIPRYLGTAEKPLAQPIKGAQKVQLGNELITTELIQKLGLMPRGRYL